MIYKFTAYGHPNIRGTHKTTFEFTKDADLSLKGDCIIGVNADFDVQKLKEFIKQSESKKVKILIQAADIIEEICAELNPDFNDDHEFVVRKTDFISPRTFAIRSNKAAFELSRRLVHFLGKKDIEIFINLYLTD